MPLNVNPLYNKKRLKKKYQPEGFVFIGRYNKTVDNIKTGSDKAIQCLCLPHLEGYLSIRVPITGSVKISRTRPRTKIDPTVVKPIPRFVAKYGRT
jgi:hypothetical protein